MSTEDDIARFHYATEQSIRARALRTRGDIGTTPNISSLLRRQKKGQRKRGRFFNPTLPPHLVTRLS